MQSAFDDCLEAIEEKHGIAMSKEERARAKEFWVDGVRVAIDYTKEVVEQELV